MTLSTIARFWDSAIVPTLADYIRIPAKSPHFDPDCAKHRHNKHHQRATRLKLLQPITPREAS